MSGSRHDWLDDDTAERLLCGEPAVAGITGTGEAADAAERTGGVVPQGAPLPYDTLAGLLDAARDAGITFAPEREDAVLAAFRAARAAGARGGPTPGNASAPPAPAHGAAAADGPVSRPRVISRRPTPGGRRVTGGRRRIPARPDWSASAKSVMTAVVAAAVLAGGVTAAAGMIPSMFAGGPSPRPTSSQSLPPLPPQMPEPAGSQSGTPTSTRGPLIGPGPIPSPNLSGDGGEAPAATGGPTAQQLCGRFLVPAGVPSAAPSPSATAVPDIELSGIASSPVPCAERTTPTATASPSAPAAPSDTSSPLGSRFSQATCSPAVATPSPDPSGSPSPAASALPAPVASAAPAPSGDGSYPASTPSPVPSGTAASAPAPEPSAALPQMTASASASLSAAPGNVATGSAAPVAAAPDRCG